MYNKDMKKIMASLAFLVLFFGILTPTFAQVVCTTEGLDGRTDDELRAIADQCDKEKAEHERALNEKQRETVTIERDVAVAEFKINTAKSDIRTSDVKIKQLKNTIVGKTETIRTLSLDSARVRGSIAELLRKTEELDSYSLPEVALSGRTLSDFFTDVESFTSIKSGLSEALSEMNAIIEKTETEKEALLEKEQNERGVRLAREREQKKEEAYRREKGLLLSLSKKEESAYKEQIAQKEAIKRAIRSKIFRTVGGAEIAFGDALKLIQPYEEVLGVESALVLAVLFQESGEGGVIGGNLGRCTYDQPKNNADGTVMSKSQHASFLAIVDELGLNPASVPVSCPIPADGQYGGAMGPAQFMPNTWWNVNTDTGYKKRIAKMLSVLVPSPFENLHAFTGTGLYLSDAFQGCKTLFSSTFDRWSCAAAKYYSGNNFRRHMSAPYSYGYKVAVRAREFQKDIDTLNL